jgi:hypothetical protein
MNQTIKALEDIIFFMLRTDKSDHQLKLIGRIITRNATAQLQSSVAGFD